jgi:hypothetical protein
MAGKWEYMQVGVIQDGSARDEMVLRGKPVNYLGALELLNELGQEGWECYQIDPEVDGVRLHHFKR